MAIRFRVAAVTSPPLAIGLGLVFLLAGGTLLSRTGAVWLRDRTAAATWARLPAVVESSRSVMSRGTFHAGRRGSRHTRTRWRPDITYRYTAQGREYRSAQYDLFHQGSRDADAVQAIVSRHAPGTTVTAIVNPADPAQAVLTAGQGGSVTPLLAYGVLTFLGLAGVAQGSLALRRSRPNPR